MRLGLKGCLIESEIGMAQLGDLLPARKRTLAFWYEANQSTNVTGVQISISGIEFRHKDDGRIELQRMLLSEEKLLEAKLLYGGP